MQLVSVLKEKTPVVFVDFHAEATSEKIAMGRFLDGKVSAVVGTHTHVQTADEQIFPGGTAFLCDVGFTGAHESVIGRRIEPVLKRFVSGLPQRFEVADEDVRFSAVLITVDDITGKSTAIERIFEKLES
ncbi:2',3'-cyclic-nucleotide 2'-phosphodiesterase [bioreactor metagenome]|uniref:2',3'-cyclic-nucleotide 2'-phosphodiesterase n=1 Tax=bioreactor metagenome TaxID=1076179 RepID=A0A645J1T7_9ZZZZ